VRKTALFLADALATSRNNKTNKMGLREVKIELNKMDKSEIIKLISEMYKKIQPVKNYLDVLVSGDIKPLIEKYKKEIEKYIYPSGRDLVFKDAEARKLIRSVQKMKIINLNIELELHYVKCCLDFISDYGYWDENYYIAIEKMFNSAVNGISEIGYQKEYEDQLSSLSTSASEHGLELFY